MLVSYSAGSDSKTILFLLSFALSSPLRQVPFPVSFMEERGGNDCFVLFRSIS